MATDTCIYSNDDCPRCAPSRAFMVQQAVLTAMSRPFPRGYSFPMPFLRMVAEGEASLSQTDLREIRAEFDRISSQYEVRAA